MITYELWERPIRAWLPTLAPTGRHACAALPTLGLLGVAWGIWFASGLPERLPDKARQLLTAKNASRTGLVGCNMLKRVDTNFEDRCTLGAAQAKTFDFALWGDSMAFSVSPMISRIAAQRGVKGLQITHAGCPPLFNVDLRIRDKITECGDQNSVTLDKLKSNRVRRVILVANWGWYARRRMLTPGWPVEIRSREKMGELIELNRALLETVRILRREEISVAVVGPIPEVGWWPPKVLAAEAWWHLNFADEQETWEFLEWQSDVMPALRQIEHDGGLVVYPHRYLCDKICRVGQNEKIFYSDPEHLTVDGLEVIRPALEHLFMVTPLSSNG